MAVPLGGGGRGLAIKIFFYYFFILLPFRNKKYFTFDNLSIYGHITLKFIDRYFYWFVTIFSKKGGYFSPKIGWRKNCQTPFCAILRLNFFSFNSTAVGLVGGGGKAFMALPLRK